MNTITILKAENGEINVFVDAKKLDPEKSQEVWNHSPTGFNVGYGGSGPAQTALAILLEVTDTNTAVKFHQAFKCDFISKLQPNETYLIDVQKWLDGQTSRFLRNIHRRTVILVKDVVVNIGNNQEVTLFEGTEFYNYSSEPDWFYNYQLPYFTGIQLYEGEYKILD